MRDTNILLLVLAALLALGGFLVTVGLESGRLTSGVVESVDCQSVLPGWSPAVCGGVTEGRYGTQDVLANPSWDWEAIGAGQIELGMTTRMVEAAWGAPDAINPEGYGESDEEWAANDRLLGFRGGVLTSIDEARLWAAGDLLTAAIGSAANYELLTYGKQVLIAGEASEIVTELDGVPRVDFEVLGTRDEIRCTFSMEAAVSATALRIGQSVVILGVGDGLGLFGPTFDSCRVFSK